MKTTTMFASTMLVLGVAGMAHAASMFAGPLFPNGASDSCSCDAVNVSGSPKTIEIQVLDKAGASLNTSGMIAIPAGGARSVSSGTAGLQYCKFVNASATNFRAAITCRFDGTEVVAMPAR